MVLEAGAGSGVPDAAEDRSREAELEVRVYPERIDKVGGGVGGRSRSRKERQSRRRS